MKKTKLLLVSIFLLSSPLTIHPSPVSAGDNIFNPDKEKEIEDIAKKQREEKNTTNDINKPLKSPININIKDVMIDTNKDYNQKKDFEKKMVYVEVGNFYTKNKTYSNNKKKPLKINSFYIEKYEVTQKEYQALMGENPSNFRGDNLPVERVSWWNAIKFCNAKSKSENLPLAYDEDTGELLSNIGQVTIDVNQVKGYRLPTEEEWKYAASGGNKSQGYTYSGSGNPDEVAWYYSNSENKTHNVGMKKPNELGIYDMNGNVWEWCTNLFNKNSLVNRIVCGGSWGGKANYLALNTHLEYDSNNSPSYVGFRIVLSKINLK